MILKITPRKVIVYHGENGEGKIETYNRRDIELSSLPPAALDRASASPKEIGWGDISKSLEQQLMVLSERLATEKDPQNIVLLVDAIAKLREVIYR